MELTDEIEKNFLTVFIDESGNITKNDIKNNQYFIIALLFTRKSDRLKRYFRKGIASLLQNKKFKALLENNGEIKGSEVTETKKRKIYERIVKNCKNDFEIGIIVLDNNYTTKEFIKNHARTFNYILQVFLDNLFRSGGKIFDFSTGHDTELLLKELKESN